MLLLKKEDYLDKKIFLRVNLAFFRKYLRKKVERFAYLLKKTSRQINLCSKVYDSAFSLCKKAMFLESFKFCLNFVPGIT